MKINGDQSADIIFKRLQQIDNESKNPLFYRNSDDTSQLGFETGPIINSQVTKVINGQEEAKLRKKHNK